MTAPPIVVPQQHHRPGEILGMRKVEIFDKKIWTVPADRMKAGEYRVRQRG
jgi:hypothetical protein